MKKVCAGIVLCLVLCLSPTQSVKAVWWTVVTEAMKKIILAMDARVQRLQNKTIGLQNAQKTLENLLSKLKLQEISEWTEKQREQYAHYFEELRKVKVVLTTIQEVRSIAQQQVSMVQQYKRIFSLLRQDTRFTPAEIQYMLQVYSGMLESSMDYVEQVTHVVQAFRTQMTDGERLEVIRQAAKAITKINKDMQQFTESNVKVRLQRAAEQQDIDAIKRLYGIR